ncbi:maltose/maltodextrin ABC transporter substrate-binding protein MalE [Rhizobacter sp. Root1221]|uniref:maltose/maltodextrin ABC transporter substrate-binding protein MalE n=1 Tax=Rhizobacter sp. Root1221 TaxID=1736433 RepID=UPI0009EAD32C|nr:maltose/maltodextrin ABC transporter substrate-binding protein MalE [Rhizobacter sp. Root1221]
MKYPSLTRRAAVSTLLGLLLASGAHAADPGVLTIWINNDKGYKGLKKVADDYTRQTGTKVRVMPFNGTTGRFEDMSGTKAAADNDAHNTDAPGGFEAAMKAGKGPDIWIWPHDRLGGWVQAGWLSPVVPGNEFRRDVVQIAWDAFTLGGQVWAYPIAVESVALIYNKDLVPNPPKTFEELLPLHNKLKAKGVRAIGWETASPYFTWPLMSAGGAYVFQRKIDGTYDATDTGINHPGAAVGGNLLQQLIKGGAIPEGGMSYGDAEEAMKTGKQAMWITGPWAWEALAKAKVNYGVAMLPTVAGKTPKPFVGVLGAMITSRSPNKDAANDFLKNHLLKREGLALMNADKPIGVPASKAMFWTMYSDEKIRTSMDTIYNGRPMPNNPEMTLFWKHFSAALGDINADERSPKEAFDNAAAAIRSALPGAAKAPVKGVRKS